MTDPDVFVGAPADDYRPEDYLSALGGAGEGPHDIALAAVMLSALDHPRRDLKPYRDHLAEIAEAARAEVSFAADGERAAGALARIIADRYSYDGDRLHYDDPANADMISVIERRRGLPVALGILYIHAARAARMEAAGLFAPGHFLLRLSMKGSETLIDPFNGRIAHERAQLVGPVVARFDTGPADEPDPYSPVSDIDILLRLLNNIKTRALKTSDKSRGIEILRRMTLIAPARGALWLELAKLYEAEGALTLGCLAYEKCLAHAGPGEAFRNEAALALQGLKRRLN